MIHSFQTFDMFKQVVAGNNLVLSEKMKVPNESIKLFVLPFSHADPGKWLHWHFSSDPISIINKNFSHYISKVTF